jgi:WD40 repeat protein
VLSSLTLLTAFLLLTSSSGRQDSQITCVALSPCGHWAASGTTDGRIVVWEVDRLAPIRQVRIARGHLNALKFTPDSRFLAIASADLAALPLGGAGAIHELRSDGRNYGSVQFNTAGDTLLYTTGDARIGALGFPSGATKFEVCCSTIFGDAVYTPDGLSIVTAGHWPSLREAESGRLLARLTPERQVEALGPIAFHADLGLVLIGSQDGRVHTWDLKSNRAAARSPAQASYVTALAIVGGVAAYAGGGEPLRVWDPNGVRSHVLREARPTSNLATAPGSPQVLFGTATGSIEFWDVETGRRIAVLDQAIQDLR